MKILELFCGLGGWSQGFHDIFPDAEFYGIDIEDLGYPYNFIKADLNDWEPDQYYDVVLASPPCTEFSIAKKITAGTDERIGLDLVYRTFYLIEQIKPKWYVIENVKGLGEFLPPPNDIVRYGKTKCHKEAWLWTNVKIGMLNNLIEHRHMDFSGGDPRRGLIPFPLAQKVAEEIHAKM